MYLYLYAVSLSSIFTFSAWGDDESDAACTRCKENSFSLILITLKFVLDMEIFCFISMRCDFFK